MGVTTTPVVCESRFGPPSASEYAVEPESVLSTDIHDRHLNDRPKDAKKLGE